MKSKFYLLLVSLLFVFSTVFLLRFFLGGDEDTWICEQGSWVKHGQPLTNPPQRGCSQENLLGADKDENNCLITAGYSWCQEKNKCLREWEEPCIQEKAFEFLSKVKTDTNLSFSGIGGTSFVWNFLTAESNGDGSPLKKEVQGKEINLENVDSKTVKEIEDYFQKENFEIDRYNLTNEANISKQGYKKDNFICVITRLLIDSDSEGNFNNINITIKCSDITDIDLL